MQKNIIKLSYEFNLKNATYLVVHKSNMIFDYAKIDGFN